MRAAQAKARALNRILPGLQDQFETALSQGELLQLGPGHLQQIEQVLAEELDGTLGR